MFNDENILIKNKLQKINHYYKIFLKPFNFYLKNFFFFLKFPILF